LIVDDARLESASKTAQNVAPTELEAQRYFRKDWSLTITHAEKLFGPIPKTPESQR
jgi:hypothetical protein